MRLQLILFIIILVSVKATTQDSPKIGLVLSGGGAKGMAHIGVLKVLEGVGIVPDYITGTSMGAVVGGLYAIGYSADELEEIAMSAQWDILLGNRTSLRNIGIEHKDYYDHYQLVLPLEGFNVGLPKGVIEGQELSEFLTRLTAPVHHISDFDSLPRPFKCIGANIATGDKVVLESGFLATAIRASMAIPTVFTPIEIDDQLLVDGGLVHNFPAEEVVAMGADIVIGVSVSDSLVDESDLNSLIDILTQSAFITSVKATEEQKKYVDYFIQPPMKPYTASDFTKVDSIIARGETAAGRMYEALKHLADSLKQLRSFDPIIRPQVAPSFIVNSIEVKGNNAISDKFVRQKINIDPGDTITPAELKACVDCVYGTLNFNRVTYELKPDGETTDIVISTRESTPGRASFDLHFDSENGVGILASIQYRNLLLKNSHLTLELDVAERPYFNGDYLIYFGENRSAALSIGAMWFRDNISTFDIEGYQRTSEYSSDLWHTYLQVESANSQDQTFGIRLFTESNRIKPSIVDTSINTFDKLHYSNIGIRPFYLKNTFDKWNITREGLFLSISGTVNFDMRGEFQSPDIEAKLDYTFISLDGEYHQFFPVTRKFNISTSHQLRLTNLKSDGFNVSDLYFVGGFKPNYINTTSFWGADKYQYGLSSFYKATLTFRYRIVRNLFVTAGLAYLETEFPMAWLGDDLFEQRLAANQSRRGSWMGGIIFNSFLGPMKLLITRDFNGNEIKPWFSVGHNLKNTRRPQ